MFTFELAVVFLGRFGRKETVTCYHRGKPG